MQFTKTLNICAAISICLASNPFAASAQSAQEQVTESADSSLATKTDEAQAEKKHTNALAKETSPYLLLHAHNPVNWYGWNDEALALAKKENKMIFLSVGYSSCHWCHVMERESFMDEEIAEFLNDNFVCIKVDREERPDVDAIYMESLHSFHRMTGSRQGGGWPLSMFLTPEAKPFFGGTYFPARDGDRGVKRGFLTLIQLINKSWGTKQAKIKKDAEVLSKATRDALAIKKPSTETLKKNWTTMAVNGLKDGFDAQYGGFRYSLQNPNIPKFPEPSYLMFLADQYRRDKSRNDILNMLETSCRRMMMGGLQDHLGGGFHRYSVDRYWAIPHFEKMLYDNGQLATVYSEAYELTGNVHYKRVVDEMLEFVNREMKHEGGAFYSALDAESEGEEGKFYRWSLEEAKKLLSEKEYELFAKVYGLTKPPNFEEKYYAPQLGKDWKQTSNALGIDSDDLVKQLKPIRKKLFDARAKRPRPLTDTKILSSWNGLMIRGFADAGRLLKNPKYVDAAKQASEFVLKEMVDDQGRLVRTYTDGEAKLNAYVEDYANFVDGLLAIHRATGEQKWLDHAIKIQKKQDELFWDDAEGGYFFTSSDHEKLLARAKKPVDGAMPSGNSVAAGNLLYLANTLKDDKYRQRAKKTALAASAVIEQFPIAAPRMLITIERLLDK